MARSRPDRQLAASKRDRYVNCGEASRMLDGLLSANQIRVMALQGQIKGAVKAPGIKKHVLIPKYIVPTLLVELEFQAPKPLARPQPNTYDAPTRWASG